MRVSNKLLSAAALAVALAAAAGSSQALVFAQFSPDRGADMYSWVNAGTGGSLFTTSTAAGTSVGATAVHFSFLDPALDPGLAFIPAAYTFSSTVLPGSPATFAPGPNTWTQTHLTGNFSFIYTGPDRIYGSTLVTTGSNLLSGAFSNAWIQGAGGSGSTNLSVDNGGIMLTLTSDYEPFLNRTAGSEEFSMNLLAVHPQFSANPGQALNSFRANGGGNFSFATAVPEPATWSLMILAFGGVGVMLRRRREGAAFA